MSLTCKHCGSNKSVKDGIVLGLQRYECKDCGKTFRPGDKRVKYSMSQKMKVLKMYLEGVGIRSIERLEGISNVLIIQWIRRFASIIRSTLQAAPVPENIKAIEILEIDELMTRVQKKAYTHGYGLLLIGTEIKLLILK